MCKWHVCGYPLKFIKVTVICDTVLDVYWTEGEIEEAVKSTSLICTDSSLLADNSSIAIYINVVFYLYKYNTYLYYVFSVYNIHLKILCTCNGLSDNGQLVWLLH